jgi:hypothetical protein
LLVLQLTSECDGPTLRSGGVGGSADRVALHRALLKQIGQLGRGEAVLMSQCQCEVGSRLTMSPGGGGVRSGDRCIPHESVDIARLGGEMHEPAAVVTPEAFHRDEYTRIEFRTTRYRQSVGDRPAGEFVAKRDLLWTDCQQAALLGRFDRGVVGRQGSNELTIQSRRHNSEQLDDLLVSRWKPTEPAEHGIDHGGRHARADRRGHQPLTK